MSPLAAVAALTLAIWFGATHPQLHGALLVGCLLALGAAWVAWAIDHSPVRHDTPSQLDKWDGR